MFLFALICSSLPRPVHVCSGVYERACCVCMVCCVYVVAVSAGQRRRTASYDLCVTYVIGCNFRVSIRHLSVLCIIVYYSIV